MHTDPLRGGGEGNVIEAFDLALVALGVRVADFVVVPVDAGPILAFFEEVLGGGYFVGGGEGEDAGTHGDDEDEGAEFYF